MGNVKPTNMKIIFLYFVAGLSYSSSTTIGTTTEFPTTTDTTATTETTETGFTEETWPTGNYSTMPYYSSMAYNYSTTFEPGTTSDTVQNTTITVDKVTVKIGKKKIKCTFFLVFVYETVDLNSSSVSCNKGVGGKTGKVSIKTKEGFIFKGVIKPPNEIISMEGGDFYADFFKNVSIESNPVKEDGCGGYGLEIVGKTFPKGYTTSGVSLWPGGVVEYNFVSDGTDELKDAAFFVDSKVGYKKWEIEIIIKAMKRIEANTCIRFKRINPEPGKKWLLMMREGTGSSCLVDYINSNLKDKTVGNLGKVFNRPWGPGCFGGAYASWLGAGSPTFMVVSQMSVSDTEGTVGLYAHELLHNLGVGHTQKRPDRDSYITVNYNNIQESGWSQYRKCEGEECLTFGSPYDCKSIMHYRDYFFNKNGGKTMTPKDPNNCDLSGYMTQLTAADVTLLKKMYCDSNGNNLISSPNYPNSNYPDNQNKEYPIKVATGSIIEILFTDFNLEAHASCAYDWVQVVDADGTELLPKTCGTNKPSAAIKSKTNQATIKFHSDTSVNDKGFRAEWKAVKAAVPINGGWSAWTTWSSCSNNKDGKGSCKKSRSRACNNPVPSNGGAQCQGDSQETAVCTTADLANPAANTNCVIWGGWTNWGPASVCNSQCQSTKTRTCTNPTPYNFKTCEGEATATSSCTGGSCSTGTGQGEVKSPNYPSNYPDNSDVSTPIQVAAGSKIELTFVDFILEDHSSCAYDYVQVLDTDNSQLIKKCGSTIPDKIISSGNKLTVKFHSDSSVNAKGFRATWKLVTAQEGGSIKSEGYPSNYPINKEQVWNLSVSEGKKVQLTFESFELEAEASCGYDYLEVSYASFKQKYCGSVKPGVITSSGNTMTVKFFSDHSVTLKGFNAVWKAV